MGEKMGIGFQLMDDYLDVYADQSKFGKQVGGDIISNKKTYLLITALEKANENQKEELHHWLSARDFDPSLKVKAVTDIYNDIGIPQMTKSKMTQYFDECFECMNDVEADQVSKQALVEFINRIIQRDS